MLVLGRGIRNEMLHSWGGDNKWNVKSWRGE
jgi:hypothetical protein